MPRRRHGDSGSFPASPTALEAVVRQVAGALAAGLDPADAGAVALLAARMEHRLTPQIVPDRAYRIRELAMYGFKRGRIYNGADGVCRPGFYRSETWPTGATAQGRPFTGRSNSPRVPPRNSSRSGRCIARRSVAETGTARPGLAPAAAATQGGNRAGNSFASIDNLTAATGAMAAVGLVEWWRGPLPTALSAEVLAQKSNGTALALDEMAHADGKTIGRTIYLLAGNVGKQWMRADSTLQIPYA